jgi:hypothetical protein
MEVTKEDYDSLSLGSNIVVDSSNEQLTIDGKFEDFEGHYYLLTNTQYSGLVEGQAFNFTIN